MAATVIMVIRHAEKPNGDVDGVEIDGSADPDSLSVLGWQRAGALAVLFDPSRGNLQTSALAVPQFLFASRFGATRHSKRPFETIQPLAAKLALTIDTTFKRDQTRELVHAARACNGAVLVSWQHQEMSSIGNAIVGNDTTVPQSWPSDRFDVVWVFTARASGGYAFTQVPQRLLAGDRATSIS